MKQRNIFSTINPGSNIWIRNPNHFLKNFDLSGIAVSLDMPNGGYAANLKSAVLISNRHVLIAGHIAGTTFDQTRAPKTVKFVNNNNEVFTYTIAYGDYVSGGGVPYAFASTDIAIGVLNTTVDPSLCFYKGLPASLETYHKKVIDSCGSGDEMPVVWIDQDKNLSIGDATLYKAAEGYRWEIKASYDDIKYQYAQKTITNDSGNAIFAIFNNELIILGTWFTGNSSPPRLPINKGQIIGTCNAIHKYYSSMNSWISAMSGASYSVSTINSSLKTFSGTKIPSIRIGSKYQSVRGYNKAPVVAGISQETSTVSLYDDDYALGTTSTLSTLYYSFTIPNPYLGLTTNYVSGKASIAGNDSGSSDTIAYQAVEIPAPIVSSRSNTTDLTPTIFGTWTQNSLTTLNETIQIDVYDNDVKISSDFDVILIDTDSLLSQTWSYTPNSNLSVGFHTIKTKAKSADNGLNVSLFSNSITFQIIDSGGS